MQFNPIISYPIYHGRKNRLFFSFLYQPFTNLIFAIRSSLSHFSPTVHNPKFFILFFIGLLFWWNARLKIGCRISALSYKLYFHLQEIKCSSIFFYNLCLWWPLFRTWYMQTHRFFSKETVFHQSFFTAYFCCP